MGHHRLAVVALAALAGCAGQPRPATPTAGPVAASGAAPAAATAPAAAAAVAASGAAPAATAASAAKTTGKAATEFKPPSGWTTRVRNGETVYCRNDASVGSRIPIHYCFTKADLQEFLWREKGGKEDLDRMMRGAPTTCASSAQCN